jgi:AraC-like DNA-binding protein
MYYTFKKATHQTPGQYRKQAQESQHRRDKSS